MRKPNRPTPTSSLPQPVGPLSILNQAIKAVPALKYALGLAGIAAAIAIIKTLITDVRIAVFGIILMLVLMTVLFIFAKLTLIGAKEIRAPAIALMWFSLLLTITSGTLLFTSVFFNWPLNLKHGTDREVAAPEQLPPRHNPSASSTYLRGVVRDLNTKQGIPGAMIELELLPGKKFTTLSDGGYSIEGISAAPGDSARVYVHKEGFTWCDEYVTLPGPKTFYLERKK
jgi:hypothetical protein